MRSFGISVQKQRNSLMLHEDGGGGDFLAQAPCLALVLSCHRTECAPNLQISSDQS